MLLRESLDRFDNEIGTVWVVTPDSDFEAVAESFTGPAGWRVMSESEVLGTGKRVRFVISRDGSRPRRGGWYFQQIIKLAACAGSDAEYCITLDADVLALRPITVRAIAPDGRALVQIEPPPQAHPHWYEGSARVLGMSKSSWHHAVTPAVLSPEVCRALIAYLDGRRGRISRSWISYLMHNAPWSEYALYNTYLEGTGTFDRYHVRTQQSVLYGDAVWSAGEFADWNAGRTESNPLFTLVQSTTGVSVEDIRDRLLGGGVQAK